MADGALTAARVTSPHEAQALALALQDAVGDLSRIVGEETDLLKVSNLRGAAELSQRKSSAAHRYVAALEAVKANAVALARWAPQEVAVLKKAHGALAEALDLNMIVLATARAVSENIVRSLARELAAPRTLDVYGASGARPGYAQPAAAPLVLSRRL